MKKVFFTVSLFLVSLVLFSYSLWKLDSSASIVKFTVKNFPANVKGTIKGMEAEISFDPSDLAHSSIKASVDINTLHTGIGLRDKHLKTAEFFDAAKYPKLTFTSKSISKTDKGYVTVGDLTMKDVTKEVQLPFTFNTTNTGGVFTGTLSVNRADYHIGSKGGIIASQIEVEITAVVTK